MVRSCSWFAQSIRCVLITPFGFPVEPEVKRILAMLSGPTRAWAASTAPVAGVARRSASGVLGSPAGAESGVVGLPVPGVELKLAPVGEKLEARLRGPNLTPGFWREPERTRAAFDEEGFYRLGDAVRFVDPGDPQRGFRFDGRLNEDYKLSTGTWVSVGPLRSKLLAHFAPYVQDVVFTGHDREFVGALIFPSLAACRELAPDAAPGELLGAEPVLALFRERLESFAEENATSSTCVRRALLLETPPTLDSGEMTEKGSINQRAVLRNRAPLVEELYAPGSARVLVAGEQRSPRESPAEQGSVR